MGHTWLHSDEGNKLDQAENWFSAAWRDNLHPEVGLHLAQVEERKGNLKEALKTYQMAKVFHEGPRKERILAEVQAGIVRLHGTENPMAVQLLQDSRIYQIKSKESVVGQATCRLLFAASRIVGLE